MRARSGRQRGDLRLGAGQRRRLCFLAKGQTLGPDDRDIGQADEAERGEQVRFLMIESRHRARAAVHTTARGRQVDLLAGQQSLGTIRAILERAARHGHPVDPPLQLRRDREIIHRRPDDDHVGGEEVVDIGTAGGEILAEQRVRDLATLKDRHVRAGQMHRRIDDEIPPDDLRTRMQRELPGHDIGGQGTGGRIATEDAGVDMQDGGHRMILRPPDDGG